MLNSHNQLTEITMFRAFTIITIVMVHMMLCFGIGAEGESGVATDSIILKTIVSIIAGNSAFFVFISGFLFYHVFYQRGFQYNQFIAGKTKKVLLPYCVTIIAFIVFNIIYYAFLGKSIPWNSLTTFFQQTFLYHAFWYIPFIMLTFALADLHVIFIKQSQKTQAILIGIFTILSMVLGRNNNNQLQALLYFTPLYLFGIICAMNYEKILNMSQKIWNSLILVWLIFTFMSAYTDNYIDIYKTTITLLPLSYPVPMKMLSCLVFIHFFRRLASLSCSWLDKTMAFIANYSFSIYFFHIFIVKILYDFNIKGDVITMAYFSCLVVTPVVISICLLIAVALKKVIGENSRMYIGA